MWELNHKESWTPKNWYFLTVVLKKTLESPLDCKIKPVNPKGNQSCIFIRRTDAEVEAPLLSQLMRRADSLEKTLMLRKFEGRRRGWQRTKSLDGIPDLIDMSLSKLWEMIEQGGWGTEQGELLFIAKSCPTLCDPMDCSMPGFLVLDYFPEFALTDVH